MRATTHIKMLCATVAVLAACVARPTQVTTTYVAPGASPSQFRRTVAVFLGGDSALRRAVEDRLASRLPNAVPSYTMLADSELADPERARERLAGAGFDGAVVTRLVSVTEGSADTTVTPSTSANPAEDLWQFVRQSPLNQLGSGRETVVTMESRVYSVQDGRALWVGRSRTFNPLSIRELVDSVVGAMADEARRNSRVF